MVFFEDDASLSALTLRNCAQSDLEDEVEDEEGEEEAREVAEGQEDDEPLSHDDHRHRHAASCFSRSLRGHSRSPGSLARLAN